MSIKAEVIKALRWTAAGRFAGQLGSWAITIYVIRVRNPTEYGLMSMATVLMGLATLINELG
jgi:O-antigen/teichoic acid export membrane protein